MAVGSAAAATTAVRREVVAMAEEWMSRDSAGEAARVAIPARLLGADVVSPEAWDGREVRMPAAVI